MSSNPYKNYRPGQASKLFERLIDHGLEHATEEERARYMQAVQSRQLPAILGAVNELGKTHYREDMQDAFHDSGHPNHTLAIRLAESGIEDEGRQVFAWIAGPQAVRDVVE